MPPADRPARVFIGSTRERSETALAVQAALEAGPQRDIECTTWNQNFFEHSHSTLEDLTQKADEFDFAVFIVDADDVRESRGVTSAVPRDNIMFELGLFMGKLGRKRTFYLFNEDERPTLPTDLAGITAVTYRNRSDKDIDKALAVACRKVRKAIQEVGRRAAVRVQEPERPLPLPESFPPPDHNDRCRKGESEDALVPRLDGSHRLDKSPLFICLLTLLADRITQAKEYLEEPGELAPGIRLLSIYDVFGRHDLLLKIEAPNTSSREVREAIAARLGARGVLGPFNKKKKVYQFEPNVINVTEEVGHADDSLIHIERGITAFVHISNLHDGKQIHDAREECEKASAGTLGAKIVAMYLAEKELIAQFYLSCGGYYDMTKVMFKLESELHAVGPNLDRTTLLAMAKWPSPRAVESA